MGEPVISWRNMIIEMLGTMFLCWYGGMAISVASFTWIDQTTKEKSGVYMDAWPNNGDKLYGIALAHGLILGIYIYAGAAAGGDCHFNPAVTVGFIISKKCKFVRGISYIIAQVIGSFLGGLLVMVLNFDGKAYAPAFAAQKNINDANGVLIPDAYKKETTMGQAALIETLNTFFLMLIVLCFTQRRDIPKSAFGGAIGLVLTCLITGSGPLTGCAANPFRALGPCILGGLWKELIIFETCPFLGAIIACLVFASLIDNDYTKNDEDNSVLKLDDVKGEFKVNATVEAS